AIETEFVPNISHHTRHGSRKIRHHLAGKLFDPLLHVFVSGARSGRCHCTPPAISVSSSKDRPHRVGKGARVRTDREFSISHICDFADLTAGLLHAAWTTGWFR